MGPEMNSFRNYISHEDFVSGYFISGEMKREMLNPLKFKEATPLYCLVYTLQFTNYCVL